LAVSAAAASLAFDLADGQLLLVDVGDPGRDSQLKQMLGRSRVALSFFELVDSIIDPDIGRI
jgi:hypothetical protein